MDAEIPVMTGAWTFSPGVSADWSQLIFAA